METKTKRDVKVYQLKVTLIDSSPPIWRRFQVKSDITLEMLHLILQIVMGWTNSHLHQFTIQGEYYGEPDTDDFSEVADESTVQLEQVVTGEGFKFSYEYDFGDGWQHQLLVEKILPVESDVDYPICLKGKRACPPEDCGGIWGYGDFLDIIQNPKHPKHNHMLKRVGGKFDPESVDLEAIQEDLKQLK